MNRTFIALATLALLLPGACAQSPANGDEHVTGFDPRPAVANVRAVIRQHGGDPDKQAVRMVIAFATGNAGLDPVRAHAMRFVAQQLLNAFLVPGDTHRAAGFEIRPWCVSDERAFKSTDRPDLWNAWPRTSAPRSIGGTDYNAALVDLLDRVARQGPRNYVIVLLGPFEGGVAPRGTSLRPLSAKSPAVASALARAGCARPESFSFPYQQTNSTVQRAVWMHVAVPERFEGPLLRDDTRPGWLARRQGWYPEDDPYRTIAAAPAPRESGSPIWIALAILAAVLLAVFVGRRLRGARRAASTLEISAPGGGSRSFIGPFKPGSVVCRLVGAGFAGAQPNDVPVGREREIPTLVLAEVRGAGRRVRLVPQNATATLEGQQVTAAGVELAPGPARKVRLKGRHQPADGRPARDFDVSLEIWLK